MFIGSNLLRAHCDHEPAQVSIIGSWKETDVDTLTSSGGAAYSVVESCELQLGNRPVRRL